MICCTDITRGDLQPASTVGSVYQGRNFLWLAAESCVTERGSEWKLCVFVLTCQLEYRNIRLCYCCEIVASDYQQYFEIWCWN